jgi:plastocyanin
MCRSPRLLLLLAVAAMATLGACGDDDSSSSPDAAADCAAEDGTTVTVEIGDFVFDPAPVQVEACDSVVWANVHDQPHTATGTGEASFNTGNVAPDAMSEPVRFEVPGAQTYICALHPFMEGTVEVS